MRKNRHTAEQADLMKKLGIPLGSDVTFVDMGEGKPPKKTYGWTDEQIQNKTTEQLEAMIESSRRVGEQLRKSLREEEERLAGFTMIKLRHLELNGNK